MRTVGDAMKRINLTRIEMLGKLAIFADWTMAQLASIYKHVERKDLSYNSLVYSIGEVDESIYLVIKGEVEVV